MIESTKRGELLIDSKKFKGRLFNVKGRTIELYRIGALAAALGKSVQTVESWEKQKLLPFPLFQISGQGMGHCRRWYSKEQIINIYNVLQLFPFGSGKPDLQKPFFDAVRKIFNKLDIVNLKVKDERTQNSNPE